MRTDPKYGVEEELTKLDDDEYKLIHLFNLVHHEDQIEYKYLYIRIKKKKIVQFPHLRNFFSGNALKLPFVL